MKQEGTIYRFFNSPLSQGAGPPPSTMHGQILANSLQLLQYSHTAYRQTIRISLSLHLVVFIQTPIIRYPAS